MAKLVQRIVVYVVGSLILECIIVGANNKLNGKTLTGKPLKNKKTKVAWCGNVILGTDDYRIDPAF